MRDSTVNKIFFFYFLPFLHFTHYHSGPGTLINSRPTLAHIETMVSFGRKNISMTNKKKILGLRMLEKHLESLGFEPTTVLDYNKPLSNFRGHFGGQDGTG